MTWSEIKQFFMEIRGHKAHYALLAFISAGWLYACIGIMLH
jgi:hypothetical protein